MSLPDLEILYEDNHLIAVNKKAGEIVQGDKSGDIPLSTKVANYIAIRDKKPGAAFIGVPHRLDRPVSGVSIFAKSSKGLERMNKVFREGKIDKRYWAIITKIPPAEEGELLHYLSKNEKQNKSFVKSAPYPGAKEARLHYRLIGASDNYFLLEIKLFTGRHHQIRAQLAAIGSPIKGDLKYGAPHSNHNGGISLHAKSISFEHPVSGVNIHIEAPPPKEQLWNYFLGR